MRLLNTFTIKPQVFQGYIPEYAILSHTWGDEEVELEDFANGTTESKIGWSKIVRCCSVAAAEGWQWVWIDTCCIDKSSSAELSEAINSMFTWYENSGICYAYLSDVPAGEVNHLEPNSSFRRSRWFTRGWTLQELLAPSLVVFFNEAWQAIGTKSSLAWIIASITGIQPGDMITFRSASIAIKMSWASNRQTLRKEDIAYCLLGLFGVSMPLIYGEGEYAFIRLQQEILKTSDDESIFAWKGQWQGSDDRSDLFAGSPAAFKASANITPVPFDTQRTDYTLTNKGLRIELCLYQQNHYGQDIYLAPLNCTYLGNSTPLALYLRKESNGKYSRYKPDSLPLFESSEYNLQDEEPTTASFLFNIDSEFQVDSVRKYTPGYAEYSVKEIKAERIGRLIRKNTGDSVTDTSVHHFHHNSNSSNNTNTNTNTNTIEGSEIQIDKRSNYRIDFTDGALVIASIKKASGTGTTTSSSEELFAIILYMHQNLISLDVIISQNRHHHHLNSAAEILHSFRDTATLNTDRAGLWFDGQTRRLDVILRPRPNFSEEDYVPGYVSERRPRSEYYRGGDNIIGGSSSTNKQYVVYFVER